MGVILILCLTPGYSKVNVIQRFVFYSFNDLRITPIVDSDPEKLED